MTIALDLETIWTRAVARGRADFLVGGVTQLSYADLDRLVRSWCALFDAKKLSTGDRIIIVSADETASITAYLAAILDGVVPVMLTPESAAPKIAAIHASIEPSLTITDVSRSGEKWASGAHLVPTGSRDEPKGLFGRLRGKEADPATSLGLPGASRPPKLPRGSDDLAYILFTSGTTSSPTGVMISRGALLAQLETMNALFGYTADSRIFNAMVLAHADGMIQGPVLALSNGAALIRPGAFSVPGMEGWLNAVRRHRATHFITVPTILAMIDRYAAHNDYFDAPEFVAVMSVAARLDPNLWRRLEERFGRPLLNQYGLTETVASVLYAGSWPGMGAVGSIGTPVNCEARIVDANGGLIPSPDVSGELQVRSNQLFAGYWKDAERTTAAMTPDGWLRTGDVALRRADGSYDVLGRFKNVIMSGGFLIRPEEVDEALRGHPMVAQSATVGLASADFEEVPMSLVVLDAPVDEAELTQFCRRALEPQNVPRRIFAVPTIPRGDAGKPQFAAVRAMIADRMASEQIAAPDKDIAHAVIAVCAKVLRVDPSVLSHKSTPQTVAGWDSFTQIELILEMERAFGTSIPASKVAAIRSVGDIVAAVEAVRR